MNSHYSSTIGTGDKLEISAFPLHDQEFWVREASTRAVQECGPTTLVLRTPADVINVMNIYGVAILIIALVDKSGMRLVLDRLSDILTIAGNAVPPAAETYLLIGTGYADRIFTWPERMNCFLNLERMSGNTGALKTVVDDK